MAAGAIANQAVWAFEEHEHRDIALGMDRIHAVACEIGHGPAFELSTRLTGITQWLDTVLEPHIAWEEWWLYPEIDARAGTPWATKAERFDHRQIRELASRVRADGRLPSGQLSGDRQADSRCHLFSLEALV
jgi:Hemerythrin HHE cation binding domain